MASASGKTSLVHLRRGGTSVLLRLDPDTLPCVLHWGPDLGDLPDSGLAELLPALGMPSIDSPISAQEAVAMRRQQCSGWFSRPGLLGSGGGRARCPRGGSARAAR